MNRAERFYLIDKMLSERKVVTRQELVDELGISWATLKRDLAYLKDRFNAPPVQASVVVFGKEYAELAPFLDKLLKLSARDIRIVEGMVQLMHTENGER